MEVVEAEPPELTPVNHVLLAGRQGHLFTRASRPPIRVLTSSIRARSNRVSNCTAHQSYQVDRKENKACLKLLKVGNISN